MIYEFQNSETGEIIERSLSPNKKKIPARVKFKGKFYNRVFTVPNMIVDYGKPKTIGSLADKNTQEMLKRGNKKIDTAPPLRPFWRKSNKPNTKLARLSNKKKAEYIQTGKL